MTVAALGLSSRVAPWRPVTLVFLPFAAGYYLSYLFRTINALIATRLMADLGLNAADLGVLTSVFFLSFAAIQLPLGMMLDRYGPRRVQIALLPIAALGAALFALADSFPALVIARALIGVGVAGSLMSGLKAIVLWFPRERIALANGCFVMLGALGAVTATAPAESLMQSIGWRGMFEALAVVTTACALLVYVVVPEPRSPLLSVPGAVSELRVSRVAEFYGLAAVYRDCHFWRLAPLSTTCIGSAWALHGLWAASWLKDVAGLDQTSIVRHLFVMALAACAGALFLGIGGAWFGRHNKSESVFAIIAALLIAAQLALVLDWPVPTALVWAVVAAVGAATVISFAILAEHFPRELAGRANAALNLLHVVAAFVLQSGIGLVIDQWTPEGGRYPIAAYQTAFLCIIALQVTALLWFVRPDRKAHVVFTRQFRTVGSPRTQTGLFLTPRETARALVDPVATARSEALRWRRVAFGAGALSILLALMLAVPAGRASTVLRPIPVERLASADASVRAGNTVHASDPQIAYALSRFIEDLRSLSTDPVVVRSRWARAFAMVTDEVAHTLNAFAADADRLTRIGEQAIIAEVTSTLPASELSFEAQWIERIYERGALARTERYTGAITIARKSASFGNEPLGFHVNRIEISQQDEEANSMRTRINGRLD